MGAPLGEQVRNFKILYAYFVAHGYPSTQFFKAKRPAVGCLRYIYQLYGGTLMAFGGVQGRSEYRGKNHIDAVVHGSLEKGLHNFPVAVGKNIHMIICSQTVGMELVFVIPQNEVNGICSAFHMLRHPNINPKSLQFLGNIDPVFVCNGTKQVGIKSRLGTQILSIVLPTVKRIAHRYVIHALVGDIRGKRTLYGQKADFTHGIASIQLKGQLKTEALSKKH